VRLIFEIHRQATPHRVFEDVPHGPPCFLIISQNMIVITLLPQSLAGCPPPRATARENAESVSARRKYVARYRV
jgi:hypothetical protein